MKSFKERKSMDTNICKTVISQVTKKMTDYVEYFVTPISIDEDGTSAFLQGSGSFFEVDNLKYLITNDHVTEKRERELFLHKFHKCDSMIPFCGSTIALGYPIDVSVTKIDERCWTSCNHSSKAISFNLFAPRHNPLEGELLFLIGYSGSRSCFSYQHLISRGTPYLTQMIPENGDNNVENRHFRIPYIPELATSTNGKSSLPPPPGMSGSLVWNTRFVEKGMDLNTWKTEDALVTGIIHRWDKDCLIATKVECLKIADMVSMLRTSF